MNKKNFIIVTGASSGIGREVAIRLSDSHPVILCGRDEKRLQETLDSCSQPGQHLIWQYDLANVETLENTFSSFIIEIGGNVSNFVHCAGYLKTIPLKMASAELYQTSFNVNVISAAIIAKVLKKKKINNDALKSIVFVSSNISNFGAKAFSAYAASKAAMDGLMRCMALELAPEVRVNSVLPGGVRTAGTEHIYQCNELVTRMEASYPLGLGTTNDIWGAVKFLLSDDSKWITGHQLVVDGGRTINITG